MPTSLIQKIELDLASYLYDNLVAEKITKEQAAEIAQKALANFPENTPDNKLEKPLVKFCYLYPTLSSVLKSYLDEIREQTLDNLRQQKLKGKIYE